VRRLVAAVNARDPSGVADVTTGGFARTAQRWVAPFEAAFPDFEMHVVELIAEGDRVVAHFRCAGTHLGSWVGLAPTRRRFEGVDEIYIFTVRDCRLASAVAVEDNLSRLRQLGIALHQDAATPIAS
jgi:predicted ester cyclase